MVKKNATRFCKTCMKMCFYINNVTMATYGYSNDFGAYFNACCVSLQVGNQRELYDLHYQDNAIEFYWCFV